MTYLVTLKDTRDGYTETVTDPHWTFDHTPHNVWWWWNEGNGSCDCNRSRRLYPNDKSKHLECSNLDIIELLAITDENGNEADD